MWASSECQILQILINGTFCVLEQMSSKSLYIIEWRDGKKIPGITGCHLDATADLHSYYSDYITSFE